MGLNNILNGTVMLMEVNESHNDARDERMKRK